MSGAATLLLVLSWCQGFAFDDIEPPQDLNIAVPTFGRVKFSWKHSIAPPNTNVTYVLKISTPGKPIQFINTTNNSSSRYLDLQQGLTAQVAAKINGPRNVHNPTSGGLSKWVTKDLPAFPGVNGTSATDLSCQINIEPSGKCFLSCSWAPGDKAPADTEYNLYYGYNDNIHRCKNYTVEPGGRRRIGGRFPHIDILVNNVKKVGVHINGTSKSLNVKAMEKIFISNEIEKIPPVQNLTAHENGLYWSKPVTTLPDRCFDYEINISSKDKNEKITVSELSFNDFHQHSAVRHLFHVRAVGKVPCWKPTIYSPWTEIELIGEGTDRSDAVGIIVALCVIAAFITTFLLCISFWRHLFPEIPKPKDDLKEAFQNIQNQALMRCNSWDNEEVISYIEEMGPSDKCVTSADYGHVADYSSSKLCKPL